MGGTTESSTEAPGLRALQINPIPASFIDFFSGRDARTSSSIAWANHFAVQPQITRPPAWCRVAVEAHSSFRRAGLIMKRISLPRFRALGQSESAAAATTQPAEEKEEEEGEEEARRIRPRLSTFTPTTADVSMPGKAPSHAEILSGLMKAKAAVANHYYTHISAISAEENQQSRENRYFKYVPRKRLLGDDDNSSIERDALTNRNRLRTYAELANILSRAAETGAAEIDLSVASCAEVSAALLQSGRDPRVHLAAQGVPDLSVIADATEVDSPSVLPKLPGAMSPVKRLAGQSSPIRTPTRRLTDSLVQLLPGSSPKASPSPTKSSTPSTPLKTSSQAKRPASSPAGFPRSPVTMHSPVQQREQVPGTPTFSSPRGSKNATPSSLHSRRAASIRDTPTKQRLRPATTPSRRNTLDFSSPYQMFSPRAATPSQIQSPLGLVASLPDQYKAVTSPAPQVVVGDVANISFGPSSPSFTHASWLKPPVNAGEIQRSKNVSNALRRRSEPLARSLHKAKIRKRSMSPQKSTHEGAESPVKDYADSTMSVAGDISDNSIVAAVVPAAAVTTTTATATADVTTPIETPKKIRGIVDVDMRKNLDIFAYKASPRINGKPAMEELARIAGSRCDGGANVIVSQENGRLVVRFKLPTEYASMFPESQGADESQFSSSPDMSASPRLRMRNSPEVAGTGTPAGQQSPVTVPPSSPTLHSSPCKGDRTIPVSDFDLSSPVVKAAHSPSFALRSSAKRTAALRAFATSPTSYASPFADSTCISFPDAIIDNDDTTIPGVRSPTQLDFTDAGERLDGFSSPTKPKPMPLTDDVEMAAGETSTTSGHNSTSSPETAIGATSAPFNDNEEKGSMARSKRARFSSPSATQKQTTNDATSQSNADADATSSKPADESPGREYMREFIKRSKPKASASTTTASTAAKPRLPLEAKSPNAESVQRPKRKLDEEDFESEKLEDDTAAKGKASSLAKASEPMPLKEKQSVDLAALTTTTQDASDEEADKDGENENEDNSEEHEADPDADELGADFANTPATRRSSRLRGKTSTAGKSSIPTPVRAGRGKAVLNSIRTEQQDLTRQTLANTRRNKGKALSAKRALAKLSVGEHEQQQQPEDGEQKASESSGAAKGGKSVIWKEPLAAYGGESKGEAQADEGMKERPKRGRGAPKAAKITGTSSTTSTNTGRRGGSGRVAKPTPKAGTGPTKQRSAKVAKRGGTGTPARMTRSRARD